MNPCTSQDQAQIAINALKAAAFNVETVAHLTGEERSLLPIADKLRKEITRIEHEQLQLKSVFDHNLTAAQRTAQYESQHPYYMNPNLRR